MATVNIRSGLAAKMRAWMCKQTSPFTAPDVCDGIGSKGRDRDRVRNAVRDFVLRGEVVRKGRGVLTRNPDWRSSSLRDAPLRTKILKAIYVANQPFTAKDIQKLSESDINYVQKMLHAYHQLGYIQLVARRGRWTVYRLVSGERFRMEVMA